MQYFLPFFLDPSSSVESLVSNGSNNKRDTIPVTTRIYFP